MDHEVIRCIECNESDTWIYEITRLSGYKQNMCGVCYRRLKSTFSSDKYSIYKIRLMNVPPLHEEGQRLWKERKMDESKEIRLKEEQGLWKEMKMSEIDKMKLKELRTKEVEMSIANLSMGINPKDVLNLKDGCFTVEKYYKGMIVCSNFRSIELGYCCDCCNWINKTTCRLKNEIYKGCHIHCPDYNVEYVYFMDGKRILNCNDCMFYRNKIHCSICKNHSEFKPKKINKSLNCIKKPFCFGRYSLKCKRMNCSSMDECRNESISIPNCFGKHLVLKCESNDCPYIKKCIDKSSEERLNKKKETNPMENVKDEIEKIKEETIEKEELIKNIHEKRQKFIDECMDGGIWKKDFDKYIFSEIDFSKEELKLIGTIGRNKRSKGFSIKYVNIIYSTKEDWKIIEKYFQAINDLKWFWRLKIADDELHEKTDNYNDLSGIENIKEISKKKEETIQEIYKKRLDLIRTIIDNYVILFHKCGNSEWIYYRFNKYLGSFLELNKKETKILNKFKLFSPKIREAELRYKRKEKFYKSEEIWNKVKEILKKIVQNIELYKFRYFDGKLYNMDGYYNDSKSTCLDCGCELREHSKFCHLCGRLVE